MLTIGEQDAVNLLRFFDDLPDPRSEINRLHRLGDVIVIAICAVIANADGPTAIAGWAELNEVWLRKHLKLPNGIPRQGHVSSSPLVAEPCGVSAMLSAMLSAMAEIAERCDGR